MIKKLYHKVVRPPFSYIFVSMPCCHYAILFTVSVVITYCHYDCDHDYHLIIHVVFSSCLSYPAVSHASITGLLLTVIIITSRGISTASPTLPLTLYSLCIFV